MNSEHQQSSSKRYAIPMPYIPSTTSVSTLSSGASPPLSSSETKTRSKQMNKTRGSSSSEINIDLMTERRSSLEASSLIHHSSEPSTTESVHSTAVVKYSVLSDPTPLARLAKQTNLNLPPSNWLNDNPSSKGFNNSPQSEFSSFKMANDFVECLADVDVVADGENIKKLLKIPYSKAPVSMVVHRVGKTLLLDDFDIHRYLLRRSASEWEWVRKFFHEIILQQIDKVKEVFEQQSNCNHQPRLRMQW